MRRPGRASLFPAAVLILLPGALVLVGILQYRWISRLSRVERERLAANVASDSARFCDDVDREVSRAWEAFQVAPPKIEGELTSTVLERLARWREVAPHPALVSRLYLIRQLPHDELEVGCLDEAEERFEACAMTNELASIAEIFRRKGRIRRLDPLLPGLVIPVSNPPPRGEPERPDDPPPPPVRQHLVVRFDRAFVSREFLARFAAARFGGGENSYAVEVAAANRPGQPFFHFGPVVSTSGSPPDAKGELFLIRSFPDVRRETARDGPSPPRESASRQERNEPAARPGPADRSERGGWVLSVRHGAGGLDAAVALARHRNLLLGGGVLVLLAAAGSLLVLSAQRAHTLAEQQLRFVAGISHELRTPLTVIRSAAQNLAADVVADREQVRRYGAMIEAEGRRLTDMIARVMAFARIRSGEQIYHLRPVALAPLLRDLAEGFTKALEDRGIRLELRVPDDLPDVKADADALRHLFGNLVDNAVKYGGDGERVVVTATRQERRGTTNVEVSVTDHGKGIRRGDRRRIFDPFFRDADVSASPIPGSGLGLSLVRHIVEAHGGRIEVESAVGLGSTFRVTLPVASAPPPREPAR